MRLSVGTLRQVVKRDLPIAFVPQQLTSYGGLELLRRYLRRIELPRRLQAACAALGGDYGGARLALLLVPRQNVIRLAQRHRDPSIRPQAQGPRPWLEVGRPASLDRWPCAVTP
jgi:hypothetical protein